MGNLYLIPKWFFGYDIIMELAFAVITFLVCLYAFKIYKMCGTRQSKLFGYGFLFISVSYIIQSIVNLAMFSELNENICVYLKIQNVKILNLWGIYTHLIFFMLGIITLTYLTLRVESKRTYLIMIIIALTSILFSINRLFLFYLLSSILLFFISIHYYINCMRHKSIRAILVFIAFCLLFLSNVDFILSIVSKEIHYVLGHILELSAYTLVLISYVSIMRKGVCIEPLTRSVITRKTKTKQVRKQAKAKK